MAKKKTTKKKSVNKKTATRKKTSNKKASKTSKKKSTKKKTTKKASKSAKKVSKKTAKKSSKKKSTSKKKTSKKATKSPKAAKAPTPSGSKPAKPPKKIKTKLTSKQLKHYQELLIEKRVELIGDIVGIEEAALRGRDTTNLSTMPLHMADAGSDTYDQDLMLGLMESERKLLVEIDEALLRIADKTYGVCLVTGQMINKARLEAKPWAKYCIEAAREIERNGGRVPNHHG